VADVDHLVTNAHHVSLARRQHDPQDLSNSCLPQIDTDSLPEILWIRVLDTERNMLFFDQLHQCIDQR
jgi:hypothetical protein